MPSNMIPLLMEPSERRERIRASALEGVSKLFPIIGDHRDIHLNAAKLMPKDFSGRDHKKALLRGQTLAESVKGDLVIKDKSGKVLDKKTNHTLLRLPYFTDQNTFVVDGNEYAVRHQLRTLPGVYTRVRSNDELEASFNLAKGANFRLSMDPAKGHMNMEYGTTKIPLYPVLRGMGLSHGDISNQWGGELAARNQDKFDQKRDNHIDKLYKKLVPSSKQVSQSASDKVSSIMERYNDTKLDSSTTFKTLGRGFDRVTPAALLTASNKLLKVHKGEASVDNRDSLEFQELHSIEDFVGERLSLKGREFGWKIKSKLDLTPVPMVEKILPSSVLTPMIKSFLTTSQLATSPMQINPIEGINAATTVTRFGEGGIISERAIPAQVRMLHPSQLGVLDPFGTPESSKAGVDVRSAMLAHKSNDKRLLSPLRNIRKNKFEFVPVGEMDKLTIAFPNQDINKGRVDVLKNGVITKVAPKQVSHQIIHPGTMYGASTNLIPFLDSTQGNRIIMGSKHVSQALSLKDREVPLVQVASYMPSGQSMESLLGAYVLPKAPVSGVVSKIDKDYIHIKDKKGNPFKISYNENHPLASKTYIHHSIQVKKGDTVKKNQVLADSNFTRNGTLALGTNLHTGYMAYKGLNSNDAVVISERAAKKLSSSHMVKKIIDIDSDTHVDHKKHSANFPRIFTEKQYARMKDGVITPGTILSPGDPIAAVLRKAPPSIESQMFGRIHKSLRRTYKDNSLVWDKPVDGKVIDVERTGNRVALTIKSLEPMKIGDKVSNRYGGKGVVSRIVPDDDMIQDESGRPLDLLWTSAGVISRINPSQILETAVAKVAEKIGKPLIIQNFAKRDNVKWAKGLLKEHGIKDKETVFDPISQKKIPGIMVGPQYTYKLFKSTETNFSARGAGGSYDVNQQPGRGGEEGAKGTGVMEVNALLAHNARDTLKENATVRGTRNSEYWRAVQLGLPIPAYKSPFAHDKFSAMLTGAGMRLGRNGNQVSMAPLTDADITKMSAGEIGNARMVRAKDLRTEKGGLFDDAITGGLTGNKWSHINLPEPIVSPVFRDPVRRLLGMTDKELDSTIADKGGAYVKNMLASINPTKKLEELQKTVWGTPPGNSQDNVVKQIKALHALKVNNLTPDTAYTLSKIPVLPPQFRPLVPGLKGNLLVSDVNHLYKDLILAKEKLTEAKSLGLPDTDVGNMRKHVQAAVSAVVGLGDPVSVRSIAKGRKGLINTITGTKDGFYNAKLISKRLDLTGRGTAAPDPVLSVDEFGMPEDMAWKTYQPFVIKRLVKNGYPAIRAKELVESKSSIARDSLSRELAMRPALLNRAPSLHRYNIIAAYPKMIPGKTIKVNPFIEQGMNLDYDGDALQVHVPASRGAVEDAKNMLISNNIFGELNRDSLMVFPQHEALIGVYKATSGKPSGKKTTVFQDRNDALAAYRRGDIGVSDPVILKNG